MDAPRDQRVNRAAPESPAVAAPLDHAVVRTILAGIMLAMFLSALEQTIVAPALPAIGKSLADIDNLSWVVTSYLLAATAATPLFGKLSDIHGRRAIILFALGIFIVGSVVCALAPKMWVLVLGRGLQGIGGGGLLPLAQTVIADILTPRERPIAQSYTSVMFMSAAILGPVLGGVLTDHLHWSFIFWINLPLGAVALVMTERALRHLPRHDRPHQLDIPGVALMTAASIALLLALDWGGTHYRWSSWPIASLFAASALLWVLFALRLLTAREPFIPLAILRGRVTSMITIAAFFSIGTIIGITIYTPLYCQMVLGVSASLSGLVLIAFMFGATIGSLVTGRLFNLVTHYMRVPIVGLIVSVAILIFLAINPARHSLGEFAVLIGLLGATIGPMYPASTLVIQNAVKPHQMGTATGTLNFFRLLGGAIIVAVFGAIVLGSANNAAGVTTLEQLTAGSGDFASAFRLVFIAAAASLAVSLACVLAVEELPLHGPVRLADKD
jgi:EmrB/QacA subfamily drug resistance transporter